LGIVLVNFAETFNLLKGTIPFEKIIPQPGKHCKTFVPKGLLGTASIVE
jgi:hypothetical protein